MESRWAESLRPVLERMTCKHRELYLIRSRQIESTSKKRIGLSLAVVEDRPLPALGSVFRSAWHVCRNIAILHWPSGAPVTSDEMLM